MINVLKKLQYILYFTIAACGSITLIMFLTLPTSKQTYASAIMAQAEPTIIKPEKVLYEYIEVMSGCAFNISDACIRAYSGPSTAYRQVAQLRIGTVLKIDLTLKSGADVWYRVVFDEWLRYPERVAERWYVPEKDVRLFLDEGTLGREDAHMTEYISPINDTDSSGADKYILVDRSEQKLYAYEGDELVLSQPISTGLNGTPTPRGTFSIYKKTPSRYMQGPLPGISEQYFDLPGVPWNLYFSQQGAVIHGAYWHDSFGKKWSHGCVNIDPAQAKKLYHWAELGTPVYVRD